MTRIGRFGLVVVMVALIAAVIGGGPASARGGNTVGAANFDFSPKKIRISPGEKVTWKATEGRHTVTFKRGFDAVISAGGDPKASKKFKKAGTYRYVCRFHSALGMKGKVVVG
jgi:plastocyanin